MIPLHEAQEVVVAGVNRLGSASVELDQAVGMVTAARVEAVEFIPPFDNTAVDGFAVQAADTSAAGGGDVVTLEIVGTIAAGMAPSTAVGPGQAIRIMTGAPMPDGADAVVMVERTKVDADDIWVTIDESVTAGAAVRGAGEDLRPGDAVFETNTELTPGHLGVLASIGRYQVEVYCRPRVAVFSTGDELIEGSQTLAPGQIRDANRHTLLALLRRDGFEAIDYGIIADDEAKIEAAVRTAAGDCDAIVTSGGVSMGDYDYVKAVLDRIGNMAWMQVAIKPAKPLAFGEVDGVPVFGLPGNPVSSMVAFELFARPALRKMMGHTALHRTRHRGTAPDGFARHPDGKTHFARVQVSHVDGLPQVRSAGGQGSHQLTAMAGANALAVVIDGDGVGVGESVEFFSINP